MKLKIAICDDEKTDIEFTKKIVFSWGQDKNHHILIKEFHSSEAFLFDYQCHKDYDILLLDIQMDSINGVELAKEIREHDQHIQIVFITGYPDYVFDGYDVSAIHYLMKPVAKDKLFDALNRAVKNISRFEKSIILNPGNAQKKISVDSIVYAESFFHTIKVTTTTENFEVKMTMYDMEKTLGDGFVRCHRSYIVGIRHISSINKSEIVLDSGSKIPLSRSAQNTVYDCFINYYKDYLQ